MTFAFSALLGFALVVVIFPAHAKIGPTGDLVIANSEIAPDGYSRIAALANGVLDGALISGNKAGLPWVGTSKACAYRLTLTGRRLSAQRCEQSFKQ